MSKCTADVHSPSSELKEISLMNDDVLASVNPKHVDMSHDRLNVKVSESHVMELGAFADIQGASSNGSTATKSKSS